MQDRGSKLHPSLHGYGVNNEGALTGSFAFSRLKIALKSSDEGTDLSLAASFSTLTAGCVESAGGVCKDAFR